MTEELFTSGSLRIECLAHFDDFLFAKKELALTREEPQHRRRQSGGGYSSSSPYAERRTDDG